MRHLAHVARSYKRGKYWSLSTSISGISGNNDVTWKLAIVHTKAWFKYQFYDDFEVILWTLALRPVLWKIEFNFETVLYVTILLSDVLKSCIKYALKHSLMCIGYRFLWKYDSRFFDFPLSRLINIIGGFFPSFNIPCYEQKHSLESLPIIRAYTRTWQSGGNQILLLVTLYYKAGEMFFVLFEYLRHVL